VDEELARLEPSLGRYVFGRGAEGWPEAIGRRLGGRTLATSERGTAGLLAAALGTEPWLRLAEVRAADHASPDAPAQAATARDRGGADLGLALLATESGGDMRVLVAITDGIREHVEEHMAFLGGEMGRRRAVNLACLTLWRWLDPEAKDRPA
jgi:hypothetical protein